MGRLSEKLFVSAVLLVLLSWAGYHAFRFYHNPLQTETVFEYTVSRSVTATGIAYRDEQVIEKPSAGIENYLYEDGNRVSIGQTVAEFYTDNSSDRNVKRMREIESEIAMLTSAQDTTVNNFSNTDVLSRDLRERMASLTAMSSTGAYSQVSDMKYNLTSLLNRRQIATGKTSDFSQRIQQLQVEYDSLAAQTSNAMVVAKSPLSGYFSKQVDGYETRLSPENLKSYTIEDFRALIAEEPLPKRTGYLGKLSTSHNWYFAVVISKYEVDWVKEGQEVLLHFDQVEDAVPAKITDVRITNTEEDAVLIFSSNQMGENEINLRHSEVTIQFYRHTGLRVSSSSLRYVDGVRGVFILDGNSVYFKTVEPIYEESGFLLSTMNFIESTDKNNVRLFDQVIISGGMDLYDGKVVS